MVFHVHPDRPLEHRVAFRAEIDGLTGPSVDLVLPSWVPGSYHIIDYVRDVGPLTATGADGATRTVTRIDKARWRVDTSGTAAIELRYSVYGHGLVTEGLDLSSEHLFLNAALCIPYVDGRRDEPYDLVLHLPPEWKVYSELAEIATAPAHLRARGYDELVDAPVDCGRPVALEFRAGGVPHRIVLCGQGGNYEPHRLEEDLRRITEAGARLFGGYPYARYTFFVHLTDVPDGGLEHATSNSAVVSRLAFRPPSIYQRTLGLFSHEYFHAFNVKRIVPGVLLPPDYTREVYTRLLWAMEGTTDYYGYLLLRRAGLLTPAKYLERLAEEVRGLLGVPGRHARSLEESSHLAWIDLYQPTEETVNRSVSYYVKGHVVSACLDLDIRHRTENLRSLDSVLRLLWERHGKVGRGVGEEELLPIAAEATGLDLGEFFARYVAGTEELDVGRFAAYAGLSFGPKPRPPDADDPEPGWLGVDYEARDGYVRLTRVRDGSPARRAGLSPGDEILAFDGVKVVHEQFPKRLAKVPAGTEIDVTVFRRGYLTHIGVTTGAPPPEGYAFTPAAEPTPLAKKVYEGWLEAPWEPATKKDRP